MWCNPSKFNAQYESIFERQPSMQTKYSCKVSLLQLSQNLELYCKNLAGYK
jgi:hypothetical protein